MSTEIAYWRKWGINLHGEENMLHYCMNCREKKPDGCEFGPVHSKEDTQWLVGYVEAAMSAKDSILQMDDEKLEQLLVPVLTDPVMESRDLCPHQSSNKTLNEAGIVSQTRTELEKDLDEYYDVEWEDIYKLCNLKENQSPDIPTTEPILKKIVRFL